MFAQQGPSNHVGHEPPTMSSPPQKGFPLMMADEGAHLRIVALHGGKGLTTRLTELGLNVGSEVRVLQRQGGGLLVARGESRIALGGGMAAKIQVAPLD
jgi:ferrous iron transport protein A